MFNTLKTMTKKPEPFETYTIELLWNDPHVSEKMLQYHLDDSTMLASRNSTFISASVNWIASRFSIGEGTRILDLGCGPGLYTTRFAELGADVTGVDISERSLNYAGSVANEKGLDISYVKSNYLDYISDNPFDLITLIYCDYCPLSPDQRKKLLKSIHSMLPDDGALLLDVCSMNHFNRTEEVQTFEYTDNDSFWSSGPCYSFRNTFRYDNENVILDKYSLYEPSRTREIFNWLQCYSVESLTNEFKENGFHVKEVYSSVTGEPYSDDSDEIAVIAVKHA